MEEISTFAFFSPVVQPPFGDSVEPRGKTGPVVQLNRISDFGSEGYRFESFRGHKVKKPFAQADGLFYLMDNQH